MRVKLGDIFEIGSGGTPSKSHSEYYGGNIPWVKTGDLKNEYLYEVEDFITEEGLNNSSAKMYEEDTVLIAMYGATIGATSILKMKACTNQACAAFRKNEQVIPEYLYYFLRSQKEKFVKDGVGGAQPNISAGYIKKVEMELPSLDEQKVIVDILDKISDVVCKRSFELQSLDDLIKARFVELFGTLHDNENGFDVVTIEDVCSLVKDGTHQTPQYTEDREEGFKFLSSKDVMSQKIDWTDIKYIPAELHEKLYATIKPQRNDILMSKNGVNYGVAAVNDTDEVFDIYVSLALLRPKEIIDPVFFRCVINNPETKRQFDSSIKGIGVPNLHLGEIKKTKIFLPPMELQNEFVAFVEQVDKSKFMKIDYINKTRRFPL
ncbi:MAG: restriction endonuclease subunit S [Lachnospiraceae bacterium]|nr:restriction endonuclease subunit S [Lachnospiraceae bacterium]